MMTYHLQPKEELVRKQAWALWLIQYTQLFLQGRTVPAAAIVVASPLAVSALHLLLLSGGNLAVRAVLSPRSLPNHLIALYPVVFPHQHAACQQCCYSRNNQHNNNHPVVFPHQQAACQQCCYSRTNHQNNNHYNRHIRYYSHNLNFSANPAYRQKQPQKLQYQLQQQHQQQRQLLSAPHCDVRVIASYNRFSIPRSDTKTSW